MKKFAILLLVACGLGALAHFAIKDKENQDKQEADQKKIFDYATDEIVSFSIKNAALELSAVREGGDWLLKAPVQDLANNFAINNLLDTIKGLEIAKKIEGKGKNLKDFGLDPALATITFTVKGKEGQPLMLRVGEKNPQKDNVYAVRNQEDTILLVGAGIDTAREKKLDDFRDKKLVKFKAEDLISALVRNEHGEFVLEKEHKEVTGKDVSADSPSLGQEDDRWLVVKPLATPLEKNFPTRVFSTLVNAEAKLFAAEQVADPASYGLDKPFIEATFKTRNGQEVKLAIGKVEKLESSAKDAKPVATYYFKRADQGRVSEIESSLIEKLNFAEADLIEKKLLPFEQERINAFAVTLPGGLRLRLERKGEGWTYTDNPEILIDKGQIDDFLQDLRTLEHAELVAREPGDLAQYGLNEPGFAFEWLDGQAVKGRIAVGKSREVGGATQYFATSSYTGYVFAITMADFNDFPKDLKAFRTKTASTIDRFELQALHYHQGETHYGLAKDKEGTWVLTAGKETKKSPQKVFELLDNLGQLQIVEFIPASPAKQTELGLDKPEISLLLEDTKGAKQEIFFGKKDKDNVVYAKRSIEKDFLAVKAVPLDNLPTLFEEMRKLEPQKPMEPPPGAEFGGMGE